MSNRVQTNPWALVAQERRQLVEDLRDMPEGRFDATTALSGWTAKAVLAHIVTPFLVATPLFVGSMLRNRGNLDKVNNKYAAKLSQRPVSELLDVLDSNAESKWSPPGAGVELPLTEIAVHAQDLRRALAIARSLPEDVVGLVNDHAVMKKGATSASLADISSRLSPVS